MKKKDFWKKQDFNLKLKIKLKINMRNIKEEVPRDNIANLT